jgi:hypothetical protein
MTMTTLAHVQVTGQQFNIHISVCDESHTIHIFKYNAQKCYYDIFDNQEDACDFINSGMPRGGWHVSVED